MNVVYAVCSAGCFDGGLDTTGVLEASASVLQRWLEQQTGGRRLRVDTFDGRPDITFFRVEGGDFVLARLRSNLVDEIWEQMRKAGFRAEEKRYLVYHDGMNSRSGSAQFEGTAGALYLRVRNIPFAAEAPPGVRESGALHELLHVLGYVDPEAPNHSEEFPLHVGDSERDLMWGRGDWTPEVLDVGREDYYGPGPTAGNAQPCEQPLPGPGVFELAQPPFDRRDLRAPGVAESGRFERR